MMTWTNSNDNLLLRVRVEREKRRRASLGRAATGGQGPNAPVFRGAALTLQTSQANHEVVISGPSETGKTFSALWYLDSLLREHPRSQAVIVRKVRVTLYGSALQTYQKIIDLRGGVAPYGGKTPEWYDYENGSRLWVAGMDNPGKALSSERDFIYENQAEELEEADHETLTTRATGRAANAPFSQIIIDCNPGAETHWIIRRRDAGHVLFLESKHEDNPTLYTEEVVLTERGIQTMRVLDALTGVRYQRLRLGRWVGAEGAYFTQLQEERHCIPRPTFDGWSVWGALDYGFAHPLVFLVLAQDPFGNVYVLGRHAEHHWYIPQHAEAMRGLLDSLGLSPSSLRIVAGHDCWATRQDDPETIADKFGKQGFYLERAVISRVIGARAVGERLGNPDASIAPSLFFAEQARPVFTALTRMVHDPKNPEDVLKVNADAEGRGGDDDYDCLRYGVMAASIPHGADLFSIVEVAG